MIQPFVTNYLQGIAENSVSAYPSIKPEAIGNLRFSFPNLLTQQIIASVLSTIDDKIELNNQINDNLFYKITQLLPVHSSAWVKASRVMS